jgi:uncharacterized protein (DUF885 family)
MRDKMMPPKYRARKSRGADRQHRQIGRYGQCVFAEPLKHFPASVSAADQKRLHDAILAAIDNDVRPAYKKLGEFRGEGLRATRTHRTGRVESAKRRCHLSL